MQVENKMPKPDFDKQTMMMQKFADVMVAEDAEPIDVLMTLCRSAFASLKIITVPDEKGDKLERMHIVWDKMFFAIAEDDAVLEAAEAAADTDWDDIKNNLDKLSKLPKP